MPNTVALIHGCPHPQQGRRLIDFLLSAEVERQLAAGRGAQIPLATDLADVPTPWDKLAGRHHAMPLDIAAAAAAARDVVEALQDADMDQ